MSSVVLVERREVSLCKLVTSSFDLTCLRELVGLLVTALSLQTTNYPIIPTYFLYNTPHFLEDKQLDNKSHTTSHVILLFYSKTITYFVNFRSPILGICLYTSYLHTSQRIIKFYTYYTLYITKFNLLQNHTLRD